jgi:uncharacterized protein
VDYVTDPGTITALYGPVDRDDRARRRSPHLDDAHAGFLAAASLVVVATVGTGGLTVSPRGGPPGTMAVLRDAGTLWLPDAAVGRVHQTVRNLMADPRIGLCFMAPGREEALRVEGVARVTVDPEALAAFAGVEPTARSVLVVDVEEVRLTGRGPLARAGVWGQGPEDPAS